MRSATYAVIHIGKKWSCQDKANKPKIWCLIFPLNVDVVYALKQSTLWCVISQLWEIKEPKSVTTEMAFFFPPLFFYPRSFTFHNLVAICMNEQLRGTEKIRRLACLHDQMNCPLQKNSIVNEKRWQILVLFASCDLFVKTVMKAVSYKPPPLFFLLQSETCLLLHCGIVVATFFQNSRKNRLEWRLWPHCAT